MRQSIELIDKISLIAIVSLFMGIIGTVPGHELTHRKREKVDMFLGTGFFLFHGTVLLQLSMYMGIKMYVYQSTSNS